MGINYIDAGPGYAAGEDVMVEVIKTRFVRESYRGLPFLNDVPERMYVSNGKSFEISMVFADRGEIKKMTDSFVKYFGQSDVRYSAVEKDGKTIYEVRDTYEGDWVLIPLSDEILCVYGNVDNAVIAKILKNYAK